VRVWFLLTVPAALGVAIWAFDWARSSRSANGSDARTTAELSALRAETQRLERQVAALQRAQPATGASVPAANIVSAELLARLGAAARQQPAQAEDPEAQPTEGSERASILQYGKYLDGVLAGSPADDATAASLGTKVKGFLDKGSSVLDLECGSDLCRMKTRHADLGAYRTFQNRAFQQDERLWSGPVTFITLEEPDESGHPLVAAIYLGRGQALPSPDTPH
jgi:hypothetical protein